MCCLTLRWQMWKRWHKKQVAAIMLMATSNSLIWEVVMVLMIVVMYGETDKAAVIANNYCMKQSCLMNKIIRQMYYTIL